VTATPPADGRPTYGASTDDATAGRRCLLHGIDSERPSAWQRHVDVALPAASSAPPHQLLLLLLLQLL